MDGTWKMGVWILGGVAVLCLTAAPHAATQGPVAGRVVVVRMEDDAFVPERVQVRRGDVVRFVQAGRRSHNVEFKKRGAPEGFNFGPGRRGPYLKQEGQVYEVAVDERFSRPGLYPIVCTPHVMNGMVGKLEVVE